MALERSCRQRSQVVCLTNRRCIAEELDRKYRNDHQHGWLHQGRAAGAAIYPTELCEAVCRGIARHKRHDAMYNTQGIYLHDRNKPARINSLGEVENISLLDNIAKDHMKKESLYAMGLIGTSDSKCAGKSSSPSCKPDVHASSSKQSVVGARVSVGTSLSGTPYGPARSVEGSPPYIDETGGRS